jgi:hypothetical protein
MKKLLLGNARDLFAEEMDGAGIWTEKAISKLEKNAFADAGGAKQDARFILGNREAHILQHRMIEPDRDVAELKDRSGAGRTVVQRWRGEGRGVCHQPKMVNMI